MLIFFTLILYFLRVYLQMYVMPQKHHPQSQQVAERTHSTKRMFQVVARIWPSSTKLCARISE